jgi:hypothetical protein
MSALLWVSLHIYVVNLKNMEFVFD